MEAVIVVTYGDVMVVCAHCQDVLVLLENRVF